MPKTNNTTTTTTVDASKVVKAKPASKPASKPKAVKTKTAPAPDPVPTPVVSESVVPDAVVVETADVRMTALIARYSAWISEGTVIRNEMRSVEKVLHKKQKADNKKAETKKSRKTGGAKKLSGFAAPTKISDELAVFLGKPLGSEMARTEVTSEITAYIKANNLQNPENGREIHPDAKLHALLKSTSNDDVSYFNLQKFMKGHYVSKAAATAAVATAAV